MSAKFPLPARPGSSVPAALPASSSFSSGSTEHANGGPLPASLDHTGHAASAISNAGSSSSSTPNSLVASVPLPSSTTPAGRDTTAPSSPTATPISTTQPPLNFSTCALCPSLPKYTCPACSLRTCSLSCSSLHKSKFSCTGIRPSSTFVPLSSYTQGQLGGDYAFLESTRRQIALWGKNLNARDVEKQEEVRRVKEREERRMYREQRWRAGEEERERERERERKEEEVRRARERGEVGWGRAFVPGLPGMPGASAGTGSATNVGQAQETSAAISSSTSGPSVPTPQSYAQLLDPSTAVALNRANLTDTHEQSKGGGRYGQNDRNKKRPGRGGKLEAFMWEMRKRGVWVEFMPEGMERRRVNQSRWNGNSQELYITLQIVVPLELLAGTGDAGAQSTEPDEGGERIPTVDHSISTDTKAFMSTAKLTANSLNGAKVKNSDTHATITYTHVLLYKGSGSGGGGSGGNGHGKGKNAGGEAKAEPTESVDAGITTDPAGTAATAETHLSSLPSSFSSSSSSKSKAALPTLSSLLPPLLPHLSTDQIVCVLPFHPSPARPTPDAAPATPSGPIPINGPIRGKAYFVPLDPTVPLAQALRGTAYVEFPTIHIHTKKTWVDWKGKGKVREVMLAEPRGKRDEATGHSHAHAQANGQAGPRHARGDGKGEGKGANEVPVSAKRGAESPGLVVEGGGDGRPVKRSKVDPTSTSAAVASPPVVEPFIINAGSGSIMPSALSSRSTSSAPTLVNAKTTPTAPAPAVVAMSTALGGLGGYGSDSEADSDMEDKEDTEGGDLGYYGHPEQDELDAAAAVGLGGAGVGQSEEAAGVGLPADSTRSTAQGTGVTAESLQEEFGLSGEMLQAVGQALVADLS